MKYVLLVDDKEENLAYLSALLKGYGYEIEPAGNGAEALAKARQTPPQVVVSDLLMPVMDGYTLLRHWKTDAALAQVPFIVYTATYTDADDERLAVKLGADAFIRKPAEPEDFMEQFREALERAPAALEEPEGTEDTLLKEYSETLISKLEEKSHQFNRVIRDLLVLTAVPAGSVGAGPDRMAKGMADALMTALQSEAVHVRLHRPGEPSREAIRCEGCPEFAEWLSASVKRGTESKGSLPIASRTEIATNRGPLYVAVTAVGIDGEGGSLAVGSRRQGFPGELEELVLSVTANQALILFQNARMAADRQRADEMVQVLQQELDQTSMFADVVGSSPAIRQVLFHVSKVAPTDSTVLITGETGTGKELVACAIHKQSNRAGRPFISVNCAALTQSLIGSELFGHERGAFTGAQQRRAGRFEIAHQGTIFLDEVGELPAETQVALLRVLQERQFQRVGGNQLISTDVRVIAATNRDLKAAIAAGAFRMDLFYRLSVFPIEMPALRERREDIRALVTYFVERYCKNLGKKIRHVDKRTLDLLQAYDWPGNIRELQNVIERSVILSDEDVLAVEESWFPKQQRSAPPTGLLAERLINTEKEIIEAALSECQGRVAGPSGAAAMLGVPPSTLENKIRALNVKKSRFKPQ